jgi:hypothetical protein
VARVAASAAQPYGRTRLISSAHLSQRSLRGSPPTLGVSPAKAAGAEPEVTSVNWVWLNIPPIVVVVLATAGIPIWMTLRYPDTGAGADEQRRPEVVGARR